MKIILSVVIALVVALVLLGIAREVQITQDLALSYENLDRAILRQSAIESTQPWYLEHPALVLAGVCVIAAIISLLAAILARLHAK